MIAAFLERAGTMSIREIEQPTCGPDEALIRIRRTGICGSDLHYFKEGRIKNNVITEPLILGHETSGEVVEVGADVHHLQPGDRVTAEPGVPCLECEYCLTGRYNLCNSVRFLGAPPNHGTFREFLNHKALFVHKLPDNVSLEEGACVEPLAVGYYAVLKAVIRPGERVLVTGAGPIGLLIMSFARMAGAHVTITDVDPYRLGVAEVMGADALVVAGQQDVPSAAFDCVVEATGNSAVYPSVVESVAKGGRIVVVGMSNTVPGVDLTALMRKEAAITTVYRYANCFQPVLKLLERGRVDVKPIVSHHFPLQETVAAFAFADDPAQDKLKILIES